MDIEKLNGYIEATWNRSILPALMEYIRIPNQSPAFDPNWERHGYMEQAVQVLKAWCVQEASENISIEVLRLPGRTPVLYLDIPGDLNKTILLYGHFDKQPEFTGWSEGLHPWEPVLRGERLYGRGSADDGYAIFSALTAIQGLKDQGIAHPRCVILIEGCEESGSYDLPFYLDFIRDRLPEPGLVICLDSSCGNYDQLWVTTSLRGLVVGTLKVQILEEGVHSGLASGVVPSSFRIIRQLLNRIEEADTGYIRLNSAHIPIPQYREQEAEQAASLLGTAVYQTLPQVAGSKPVTEDLTALLLNRSWRPALSIVGAQGLPNTEVAGNVLRPFTELKLSLRLPPHCDPVVVCSELKKQLETNPPYGAKVSFEMSSCASGWEAPKTQEWLLKATQRASRLFFGQEAHYIGEGGTIPFMAMLGKQYPSAQFLITGVLGPQSNAHGPNEFLHIPMAKKLTGVIAEIIRAHYHSS